MRWCVGVLAIFYLVTLVYAVTEAEVGRGAVVRRLPTHSSAIVGVLSEGSVVELIVNASDKMKENAEEKM